LLNIGMPLAVVALSRTPRADAVARALGIGAGGQAA